MSGEFSEFSHRLCHKATLLLCVQSSGNTRKGFFACFLITNHDISAAAAERNKKCVCVCVCVAGGLRIKLEFFKRKESPTYNSDTLFTRDPCNAQDIVEYGGTQRFFVL